MTAAGTERDREQHSLPVPCKTLVLTLYSPTPQIVTHCHNLPFLISDIRALWRSALQRQSARMSEIKNIG